MQYSAPATPAARSWRGKHAVTQVGGATYGYDANGNMTTRGAQTLTYDAENRLTQVISGTTTTYAYNADGARVKRAGSTTTYYVGNWFEVTQAGVVTKYYYFGGKRVAVRENGTPYYLHGDHLGSTSVTSDASRNEVGRQTYYAFGSTRTISGSLHTDYTFTGQKLDAVAGLMYYGARYYDYILGRFISADTIVPGATNPQALNRYAYVLNNPLKYTDPTGHAPCGSGSGLQWEDCPVPDDGGGWSSGAGGGRTPPTETDRLPILKIDLFRLFRLGLSGPGITIPNSPVSSWKIRVSPFSNVGEPGDSTFTNSSFTFATPSGKYILAKGGGFAYRTTDVTVNTSDISQLSGAYQAGVTPSTDPVVGVEPTIQVSMGLMVAGTQKTGPNTTSTTGIVIEVAQETYYLRVAAVALVTAPEWIPVVISSIPKNFNFNFGGSTP